MNANLGHLGRRAVPVLLVRLFCHGLVAGPAELLVVAGQRAADLCQVSALGQLRGADGLELEGRRRAHGVRVQGVCQDGRVGDGLRVGPGLLEGLREGHVGRDDLPVDARLHRSGVCGGILIEYGAGSSPPVCVGACY